LRRGRRLRRCRTHILVRRTRVRLRGALVLTGRFVVVPHNVSRRSAVK
jgi:hypothetical protein